MVIRDATLEDLPAIVSIYNSTIPTRLATADLEPVTVEKKLAWFNDHTPARRPLWVVINGGQVIAWMSFSNFSERAAYDITAEISIYIDAAHRGQGLGNIMMLHGVKQAPDLGIEVLLGKIFAHNEPSIRLFEKFGFEVWGTLPDVCILDGVHRGVLILGKKLK
ncbi:N-acetyltransferase [Pseudoflavitalea sp. G-6-1-2]|uniref:GNAT family N-acetyltransferase n=1 Tax=Pseudoflavitalea sp. G-6-1-2 TaxID=2728841 RepID=UPI00146AD1ED|nr:GNAT family N-acetyltransferase [Pseudoflavitalea sp. G-6-1-2]NML22828.1 N-acetyltransferase [Pseudoflavitalea sp. G-6-1-2]